MKPLNVLYDVLDFKSGGLYAATGNPSACRKRTDWVEKGEWLTAAKRVGAEKIFFVENNPVAVFSECGHSLKEKVKAFNRAWCLARPRLLFLASPGEISVFDLAQKPIDIKDQKKWKDLKNIAFLSSLKKVADVLQIFHRDNIESGRLFSDRRFGDLNNRADKALIRDLKAVRMELSNAGLSGNRIRFAHALIGRSIFIRYLEDRGIITKDYFLDAARQGNGWADLLDNPPDKTGFDFSDHETFFPRVLTDKSFTYALFRKLSLDFNGDMFPDVDEEEQAVSIDHLKRIQDLLYGDVGVQKKLFFHSYRFDIIPLDLISSIYEEFYHGAVKDDEQKQKVRQNGVYYTPPVLAEFTLSKVLTLDFLKNNPRVLDPACGSGIFLVEAFRRIVRYEWHRKKQPLTFDNLKSILQEQIAGIEINEEAARIAAFSLYLSMLHYLDPPSIDRQIKMGNRLPNLVAANDRSTNHFHCILHGNAFDEERIASNPILEKRFGKKSVDVVVGNPPWGAPGNKADKDTKAQHQILVDWCHSNNKPIGYKEPSQAFLWRAAGFLKNNGRAGMLVSAGVLFKHGTTSREFREEWLSNIRLDEVFNFSHVRKFFFKGGTSPFLSVFFRNEKQNDHSISYWSAKQVATIHKTQAITLSKYDRNVITPKDVNVSSIWKEYWFGRPADTLLLDYLRRQPSLEMHVLRRDSGRGFEVVSKGKDAKELKSLNSLGTRSFSRYDALSFDPPPEKIYRFGTPGAYWGDRLLVKRGIDEKPRDRGCIIARYETEPFSFTHSIYGIKLELPDKWKYKTLLGIFWSSVARYYFFMTSSHWGLWHHKIHFTYELLKLPVVLDNHKPATQEIVTIVDKLRGYHPEELSIEYPNGKTQETIWAKRLELEARLDEAVFQLYGLNEEQKDLIRDFCDVTLPFFYRPFNSIGTMRAVEKQELSWIKQYIEIFSRRWNAYLDNGDTMKSEIHIGAHENMIAVEFYPDDKDDPHAVKIQDKRWGHILEQIGEALPESVGSSRIILDGVVHMVSDSGIIILKRNEKRFWTRSLAREDADATICNRMVDTMPDGRSNA